MTRTALEAVKITCDQCGSYLVSFTEPASDIDGTWESVDGRDLCPTCSGVAA